MGIAALMRAANDDIQILSGHVGKGLIKVKVVAYKETEAKSLHLDDGGLTVLETIVAVQPELGHLAGGQMLLKILSCDLTIPIKCVGSVSNSAFMEGAGIDKNHGMTATGRLGNLVQKDAVIAGNAGIVFFAGVSQTGDITGLRHDDQIQIIGAGIQCI